MKKTNAAQQNINESTVQTVDVRNAETPPDTSASDIVFCMNCGAKMRAGDKFCLECGIAVDAFDGREKFCMNCGGAIGDGDIFCLNCGTPVGCVGAENDDEKQQAEASAAAMSDGYDGPILKVEHLKKYFPIKTNFFGKPVKILRAVDDINFTLDKGKTIGVVGESGCGKTTLGRTILKLHESSGGKIYFEGDDITDLKRGQMKKYRTDIQLIFQDPYSSLPPRMTVGSIIAEPVRVHGIVPKSEVHSYVLDIMKKCGLKPQHYDRYPHEFSGGQRQRICIARALAVKPKLVICDEPVSALDVSIQAQIINLLKELQQTIGLTYVFISHDLSVVKYITDKILVMYLGNAMEMSETDELFDNPLHPYTQALFSAVPEPDPTAKMNRIVLEGDIPSPANPPSGCKFHTRCAKCMKVCKFKIPEYTEVKPDHFVACHLYNEEIMSHLDEYDAEYDRMEEQRLAEERELAAKKLKHKDAAPSADGESAPATSEPVEQDNAQNAAEASIAENVCADAQPEREAPSSEVLSEIENSVIENDSEESKTSEKAQATEKSEISDRNDATESDDANDAQDDNVDDGGDNCGTVQEPSDGDGESVVSDGDGESAKSGKAGKSAKAPKSRGAKSAKSKFVDDGRTLFSMQGLEKQSKKPAVELTGKERRAMIRAAFAKYFPVLIGAVGCFSLAALLLYFWFH